MTNGSHGCINLPPAVAKVIFENISPGVPVLCYHLDGTDSKGTSGSQSGAVPQPTAAPTAAAQTPPAEPVTESSAEILPEQGISSGEGGPVQEPQPESSLAESTSALEVPVGPGGALPETSPEESSPLPVGPGSVPGPGNSPGGETESSLSVGPGANTEIGPGVY